jgi:hypothetical protein
MAKKKDGEAVPDKADDGYTVGKWSGLPNYICSHAPCQFSTLEETAIKEHVFHAHIKATLKQPGVLLYDADGNPVYAPKQATEPED